MSEYRIHHDVNQLFKLLEVEERTLRTETGTVEITANAISEQLIKSADNQKNKPKGATAPFLKKLDAHHNPELKNKYEDLKAKNVHEVEPFVNLMARISEEPKIKHFLKWHKIFDAKRREKQEAGPSDAYDRHPSPVHSLASRSSIAEAVRRPLVPSHLTTPLSAADSFDAPGQLPVPAVGREFFLEVDETRQSTASKPSKHSTSKPEKRRTKDREKDKDAIVAKMRSYKSDHPFLSLDYSPIDWNREAPIKPLGCLSLEEQERCLIDDLLFVLMGMDGQYIRMTPLPDNPRKFNLSIDDSGDKLLYTLANRIQRLCPMYSSIIHFVEDTNHGLVNQALGGFMREQLKDFITLLAQLETQNRRGQLTLQRMWYFLQTCFQHMDILKAIVDDVAKGNSYGGATLSILHQVTLNHSGDEKAQAFCLKMTRIASEPYFDILEKWIYQGVIDDPYLEFFIVDKDAERQNRLDPDSSFQSDTQWESRFTIAELKVPKFLESLKSIILKTGKYLSVIRTCGKKIKQNFEIEPLGYTSEERYYREKVESAYKYASQELLALLINELDLIGRLNSIKHYFLMDQGDFIVQFMDMAEDELEKDILDIVPTRLESLLELALRTSVLNEDPYKDDVHIDLRNSALLSEMKTILCIGSDVSANTPDSLNGGMPGHHSDELESNYSLKGFQSIAFKYYVQWPLSLILSEKNMACYQMLFRHLFYCKYIERRLEGVWKTNKVAKCFALCAVVGYAQAFALRQKMLNFVQNILYYMMVELIEPAFHIFIQRVRGEIHNVDDMIKKHNEFVEDVLKDGMLTEGNLLSLMIDILSQCITFSRFMQETHEQAAEYELQGASEDLIRAFQANKSSSEGAREQQACSILLSGKSFEEHVSAMHTLFNGTLIQLLQAIAAQSQDSSSSSKLLHILYRLDFNGFYSKFMDEVMGMSTSTC